MRTALLALALLPWAQAAPASNLTEDDRTRFLVAAVFEGLVEDGPDPLLFAYVLTERDAHFVAKCPICWPVVDGMRAYFNYKPAYPCGVRGFPEEIRIGFRNTDRKVRLKAIEAMIGRYVARRFERMAMTDVDKARMRALLEEGKKAGMSFKEKEFGDYCPSCTGATKK
jgi:hypothetical protein